MFFLPSARWRAFFVGLIREDGGRLVGDGYGHLRVLVEGRQRGMIVPEGRGVDELEWEFIGKQRLGMDRGGSWNSICVRLLAMRDQLVMTRMKVGVEHGRVHDSASGEGGERRKWRRGRKRTEKCKDDTERGSLIFSQTTLIIFFKREPLKIKEERERVHTSSPPILIRNSSFAGAGRVHRTGTLTHTCTPPFLRSLPPQFENRGSILSSVTYLTFAD